MGETNLIYEDSSFDTNHFGFPCATLNIPTGVVVNDRLISVIQKGAISKGIKFLTVVAQEPIKYLVNQAPGALIEYEAVFDHFKSRTSKVPQRFHIKPFSNECWEDLLSLAQYRAENRFSTDAHFDSHSVHDHKLKLYRRQCELFPKLTFLAYSDSGEPLGFHIATFCKDGVFSGNNSALIQYDLVVKPEFRTGTVALDLINASVKVASGADLSPKRVLTRIYNNNHISRKFFQNLGLILNGKQYYYHHFWF